MTDVTGAYGMLNLQGPRSRDLLSNLTDQDLSLEAFPFGSIKDINLGYQTVKALRITYMGELGWELYVPTEFLLPVYDSLVEEGKEFDLKHCGYHALNSLRIEKAYREWGHDIGSDDTPLEAGLGFASDFKKDGGFLGKEALLKQKEEGRLKKRLVQFCLDDPIPMLYHNEPIWVNGELNSFTTSAMYGHTLGGSVALGYVYCNDGINNDFIESSRFEIEVAGTRYPAKASLRPMYDSTMSRIKV